MIRILGAYLQRSQIDCRRLSKGSGYTILQLEDGAGWSEVRDVGINKERRVELEQGFRAYPVHVLIENSVSASPDEARQHLVSKAKTRREIEQVWMNQRAIVPAGRVARRSDDFTAVRRREVRGLVIPIYERSEKFIAKTVSKGEFGSRSPGVHGIEGVSRLEVMDHVGSCVKRIVYVSEHQIRQAKPETGGDRSGFIKKSLRCFYVEEIVGPP